jgi:hypothetical protein
MKQKIPDWGDVNDINPEDYEDADEMEDLHRRMKKTLEKEKEFQNSRANAMPQKVS